MAARRITITNGSDTVVLMKDLIFTIKPKNIGATATMASGKTVMDVVGVKNTLTIPTGWLPRNELLKLRNMINVDRVLSVTYPDVNGDTTADFLIDQPQYEVFKYSDDGAEIWCGVTLTMTQQGVF